MKFEHNFTPQKLSKLTIRKFHICQKWRIGTNSSHGVKFTVWNLRFNIFQHGHIVGFCAYAIRTTAHALTRIDNFALEEERFLLKEGSSSANTVHVIKSVIDFWRPFSEQFIELIQWQNVRSINLSVFLYFSIPLVFFSLLFYSNW